VAPDDDNAIARATDVLLRARYVIALTGAGLSVESGIPPFRGPGGLWTKYGEPPMNGYERFLADPKKAWADRLEPRGPMRELWNALAQARPNPGHVALADLETLGVLKALITQNVDDLHRQAGSRRLLEIHGNATLIRATVENITLMLFARLARRAILADAPAPPQAQRTEKRRPKICRFTSQPVRDIRRRFRINMLHRTHVDAAHMYAARKIARKTSEKPFI